MTSAVPDPALDAAVSALLAGRPVVVPTDTVYGVAVSASFPGATQQLFALKDRSVDHPLAVLVHDTDQARTLVVDFSKTVATLVDAFWPGPLTLVVPRRPELVDRLELGGDGSTVGLRCPDHAVVRELSRRVGPIATTSANRHGEATPSTAKGAVAALSGPVAAVIDGGVLDGVPSTVIDCTSEPWRLLREGAVPVDRLRSALGGTEGDP